MSPTQGPDRLSDNLAGMLAYLTFIPALIFLNLDPYKQSRFVRFHAYQSLVFAGAVYLLKIALGFAAVPLILVNLGFLVLPALELFELLVVGAWVLCAVKAYNRELYRLPVIGDLAAQLAGT